LQIQPYSSTTWWRDILNQSLPSHLLLVDVQLTEFPVSTSKHWGKLELIQDPEDQESQSYNEYLQSFIDEGNIFNYGAERLEDCTLFMTVATVIMEKQDGELFAQIEIPLVIDQTTVSPDVVGIRKTVLTTVKTQLDELLSDIPEFIPHRLN
jgi:hypothetical protein